MMDQRGVAAMNLGCLYISVFRKIRRHREEPVRHGPGVWNPYLVGHREYPARLADTPSLVIRETRDRRALRLITFFSSLVHPGHNQVHIFLLEVPVVLEHAVLWVR